MINLESLRLIFPFVLGGEEGNKYWKGLLGIFWKACEPIGPEEALVMLANDCDYLVNFPYSPFFRCPKQIQIHDDFLTLLSLKVQTGS